MTPPGGDAPEGGWESLKVAELQEELEARGLPKSGKKAELVARLEEDDQGGGEADAPEAAPEAEAGEEPEAVETEAAETRPPTTRPPRSRRGAAAARPRPACRSAAPRDGRPTARSWSVRAPATCAPRRARRDS